MDLNSRLASTVHDVKNKLQLISSRVEELSLYPDDKVKEKSNSIQRGLRDVNDELVALLGLYRLDRDRVVSCQEVFVSDLLTACIAYCPSTLTSTVECDADLVGFFDEGLVRSVVSDALHNSVKFANSRILITAEKKARGVVISVEDDGPGFGVPADADRKGTGLGLHFARQVAGAHRNKDEYGSLNLSRSGRLGGAAFRIYLP